MTYSISYLKDRTVKKRKVQNINKDQRWSKYPSITLFITVFTFASSNNWRLFSSLASLILDRVSAAQQHMLHSNSQASWLTLRIWAFPAFLLVISNMKRMRWMKMNCLNSLVFKVSCQTPSALAGTPPRNQWPLRRFSLLKAAGNTELERVGRFNFYGLGEEQNTILQLYFRYDPIGLRNYYLFELRSIPKHLFSSWIF